MYGEIAADRTGADAGGRAARDWTATFVIWAVLALLALPVVSSSLGAAFPIFTVVWLVVPLAVVARTRDARLVGLRSVPWPLFVRTTLIYLAISIAVMAALEPWSHAYSKLVDLATAREPFDSTFVWLVRWPRIPALGAMAVYSGLVTMFGEELFFRGWLLQALRGRIGTGRAIVVQAALFTLPNLLAAVVLGPVTGSVYALYAFVLVGLVGGWAAARTSSIWPSLITVTISNLAFVAAVM